MPYDSLEFLLDRANIEDVIRKIVRFTPLASGSLTESVDVCGREKLRRLDLRRSG